MAIHPVAPSTRHPILSRVLAVAALFLATVALAAVELPQAAASVPPGQSMRAVYHLTPPDNWLSDPQRPVYANGKYNLYYLYSDRTSGQGSWRHASTTDNVVFKDEDIAIPQDVDFPVWTGSSVVDTNNTAGFGAGAIIALATQPTNNNGFQQEQYLWYSTDGGNTFTEYGNPVIVNPNPPNDFFRDPKIEWDAANNEWVAVIGMAQKFTFYTSPDLKTWTHQSDFTYNSPNIGGFECPDLFRMRADDGSIHWVLAGSTQGDLSGQPDTLAYWTGDWDGTDFTPDDTDPQWLDWGWDWYASVTWADQATPLDKRYGIGWMNNWHYAAFDHAPTDATDNYHGQMSVVREIELADRGAGQYTLLSQPVATLDDHVARTITPANETVNGNVDLDYHGTAYQLEADVSWSSLDNVGISVGTNADHTRYTNVGVYQGEVYVDRSHSDQPGLTPNLSFGQYQQSEAPFGSATSVHLKILVDKSSVEVFVDDGERVLSNLVYFKPGDTGIRLYTDGGSATFSNISIKEFEDVTMAADPSTPYADFESTGYGSWGTTGTAFGSGPAAGTLPNQQTVSGFTGSRLVNSFNGGDTSTGVLSSPNFTVSKPFLNFRVGGGRNPRPSSLFNDFEGTTWGTGWTATGSYSGQGPTTSSLPNQVGSKVLDTFVNGFDPATGTITSPQFTITRDYIDFLIAGGNHPWPASGATAVNLLVDGVVYRTATGNDSSTMTPVNWDVHDLVGRTAQIQVVDNATGTWGHLMVDQIIFTNGPNAAVGEPNVQTTVNLVVGGNVVRTMTGQNDERLRPATWLVDDLVGQTAHLEIIDNNSGSWGHILADQFAFDDRPVGHRSGTIPWNGGSSCIDRDVASSEVQIWSCLGGANQRWSLHADGQLTTQGACMELPPGQTANNTLVRVGLCNGSAAQKWALTGSTLVNQASGRCLDLPAGNTTNGTQLEVYDCVGGANQTWNVPST